MALLILRTRPRADLGISAFEMMYGMPYRIEEPQDHVLIRDNMINEYISLLSKHRNMLWKKGLLVQRPPLDLKIHNIEPGEWVMVKAWREESLKPKWEGPYLVLLTTETAVRTAERGWTHASRIKGPPIYICPASNFGKGYCNQPGHFYCGYWGCETWASDWNTPGDKHMSIEWMPKGCERPTIGHDGHIYGHCNDEGYCKNISIVIKDPENDQWLAGKYWGIRYWEPGPDRGGIFMISKRPLPHDPHPIGPNPILNPVLPTLPNKNHESTQEIPLAVMVHESELQDPLWDMMQTSYLALNSTRPDLTEDCWLCYNVRPPYFEAIGKTSKIRWSNGTNPQECDWGEKNRTRGITLQMVTGQGRCIGKVPINYQPLCNQTISNYAISQHKIQGSKWAIPSGKAKWVCSDIGITPCLSLILFDYEKTFCIQVLIILRIMYHASEEIIQYFEKDRNRQKREPITAITIATILAISGVGTGIASLVKGREIQNLQMAVDEDLERIQKGIDDLAESVHSLSEVVLQNRRGLDLLFLKDGGLCVALREECCSYVDRLTFGPSETPLSPSAAFAHILLTIINKNFN
uniref:Uncharacterized protein n=1 Tax=Aquila chrysaetos chrysaetos TaxID=223781 RepID=A0A663F1M2_AQUCH